MFLIVLASMRWLDEIYKSDLYDKVEHTFHIQLLNLTVLSKILLTLLLNFLVLVYKQGWAVFPVRPKDPFWAGSMMEQSNTLIGELDCLHSQGFAV